MAEPTQENQAQWMRLLEAHPDWGKRHGGVIADEVGAALCARVAELERDNLVSRSQGYDKGKDERDDLRDALLAILGAPDFRTEYECQHGTPLGQKCGIRGCHLNPVRLALKHLPKSPRPGTPTKP